MSEIEAKGIILVSVVYVIVWIVAFLFARHRDWEWPLVQSMIIALAVVYIPSAIIWIAGTFLMAFLTVIGTV